MRWKYTHNTIQIFVFLLHDDIIRWSFPSFCVPTVHTITTQKGFHHAVGCSRIMLFLYHLRFGEEKRRGLHYVTIKIFIEQCMRAHVMKRGQHRRMGRRYPNVTERTNDKKKMTTWTNTMGTNVQMWCLLTNASWKIVFLPIFNNVGTVHILYLSIKWLDVCLCMCVCS